MDEIITNASTLDYPTAMVPKKCWIEVEVVRADGTKEPVELIEGELLSPEEN